MRKLFSVSLKRLMASGLALVTAIVLVAPSAANATPYVVTLTEQGGNVVASGSGAFDLTGLTFEYATISVAPGIISSDAYVSVGPILTVGLDAYTGFTGPTSFGGFGGANANIGSGDWVGLWGSTATYGVPLLWVPQGYVSEAALTGDATWNNTSFASLGLTPGTYTWTWGSGADQSFTLMVVNAIPEPAALGVFGLGVLLVGGFVTLRRREQLRA